MDYFRGAMTLFAVYDSLTNGVVSLHHFGELEPTSGLIQRTNRIVMSTIRGLGDRCFYFRELRGGRLKRHNLERQLVPFPENA